MLALRIRSEGSQKMAKMMVRTAVALAVATSVVALPTAASAENLRPGQSVVSAERAAAAPSQFQALQPQQRAGAEMQGTNQVASKWLIFFIAGVPFGWAVYKIISP